MTKREVANKNRKAMAKQIIKAQQKNGTYKKKNQENQFMGTSRGKKTPTTIYGKRRKSQLKTEKRLANNREILSKFK